MKFEFLTRIAFVWGQQLQVFYFLWIRIWGELNGPKSSKPCSVEIRKYWYWFYNAVSRCLMFQEGSFIKNSQKNENLLIFITKLHQKLLQNRHSIVGT